MKNDITQLILIPLTLCFFGCSTQKSIQKTEPAPPIIEAKSIAPEISIRFASIDMSKYEKRFEIQDVQAFAAQLKNDSIDILTIDRKSVV